MCAGGSAKKEAKKQRNIQKQQMAVQQAQFNEQMAAQRQTLATQQAQYEEQFEIANTAPPPAPNPVAEAADMATEPASAAMARMGSGRRAMRTDLGIPAAAVMAKEPSVAVREGTAKYQGKPRRSKARANAALAISEMPAQATSQMPTQEAAPTPAEERKMVKVQRKAAKRAARQERRVSARSLSIPGQYARM